MTRQTIGASKGAGGQPSALRCLPSLREGSLRCSVSWPVAELATFAALSALKQPRRVRARSALRARPRALRFSAAQKARRRLPARAFAEAPRYPLQARLGSA